MAYNKMHAHPLTNSVLTSTVFFLNCRDYPDENGNDDNGDDGNRAIFQGITVSLYGLCGVESPGFCSKVRQP